MKIFKVIKYNLSKIIALTEKNLKLSLRFKYVIVIDSIFPVISIILPLIIMSKFLEYNAQFGPWTKNNFLVYQFIAFNITLLRRIINDFPVQYNMEKFWQTLPALIIAPSNRFNMLFGIFFSRLILICVPFMTFFVICYIIYPITFSTILIILCTYILIALIFSGIGLIIGIFIISNENISNMLAMVIGIFFTFSCLTYPFEIFPEIIQNVIILNPLYYVFDILRLLWLENNILISFATHSFHFFILVLSAIVFPSIGVYIFNLIYKKFGIVGA